MPDVALTFQVRIAKFSLNLTSGRTLSWRSTNLKRHCWSSPLNVISFWFPVYLHWIFYPQFIKAVGFSRQICHMLQDASRADKFLSASHKTRCVPQNLKFPPNMPDYQAEKGIGAFIRLFCWLHFSFGNFRSKFSFNLCGLCRSCCRQREAIFGRILHRWRWWKDL